MVDTNCYLERTNEYTFGTVGACDALCLTETNVGKECFTSMDIDV